MRTFIIVILCVVALSTVVPHVGPVKSHAPRKYKVSLDDSLEDRWRPVIKDYYHHLKLFMAYFDLLPIPDRVFKVLDQYAHGDYKHKDFVAEIDALSKVSGY
jgi:hypothetical protein